MASLFFPLEQETVLRLTERLQRILELYLLAASGIILGVFICIEKLLRILLRQCVELLYDALSGTLRR